MASLVLKMSVSLDGYVASVDGSADWKTAGRSTDSTSWVVETVSNARAHLVGAATDAEWARYCRRRQTLTLTAAGRAALRSAQALLSERLSSLLADTPRPELDALARALPRVAATLFEAPPPRRPPPPPPAPGRPRHGRARRDPDQPRTGPGP